MKDIDLTPSAKGKVSRPFSSKRRVSLVFAVFALVGFLGTTLYLVRGRGGGGKDLISGYVMPEVTVDEESSELDQGEKGSPSPINGVFKTAAREELWTQRRPLAVMINNHAEARSVQTGVTQADLVYEAVAEGGIPRLMAIYHSQFPNKVGSVRSARVFFVDWAKEYDAWYAHWGGAQIDPNNPAVCAEEADAFMRMRTIFVSSLDAMGGAGEAFFRDTSGLALEHTGFAVPEKLLEVAYRMYPDQAQEFRTIPSWQFGDGAAAADRGPAAALSFNFWDTAGYEVTWEYDPQANLYLRSQGGEAVKDAESGERYSAKTVIVQWMKETEVPDQKHHILYQTLGSGAAQVYADGQVIEGSWSRPRLGDRTRYYDDSGQEIEFNRGVFWIEVLPLEAEVTYQIR